MKFESAPEMEGEPRSQEQEFSEWRNMLLGTMLEIEEGVNESTKRTGGRNSWVESLLNQFATFEQTIDFYRKEIPPNEFARIKENFKKVAEEAKDYQTEFEKRGRKDDEVAQERILQNLFNILG